ncbi:MAG: hypothetical protein ACTSYM_10295 [Candidatus Baldrarchaeia archaeon]
MCAPVSVSMTPVLSIVSALPAIILAIVSGAAGVALIVKGLVSRGE